MTLVDKIILNAEKSEYFKELFDKLAAYLKWDMNNRDDNNNGLLEWLLEDDINCRCGESGWIILQDLTAKIRWIQ